MKYNRFREYLARNNRDMRARDMRNPYGSRGGYVVSDKRGNDYEMNNDYARGNDYDFAGQYNNSRSDRLYPMYDSAENSNHSQSDRGYNQDNYYSPVRRSGYFDYNTYEDMRDSRDYANDNFKLKPSEIRKWEKELSKNGGSNFSVDQIRQVAQQNNIKFDEFSPELLTVVSNMMYSDYGKTVKGDITMYVKLAKDFLCDMDFDGTPEEKAYLYYNTIINKEDD